MRYTHTQLVEWLKSHTVAGGAQSDAYGGANQSPRVTQLFINKVDDAGIGTTVTTANVSGSIVQPYGGQLGGKLTLSPHDAVALSFTSTGTLYAGIYQYVQFKLVSTAANAVGQPVFWTDLTGGYIVSPDGGTEPVTIRAGITITLLPTKGNYGFIQIAGIANIKFGTVTKATPAVGDAVFLNATPANPRLADDLSDTTTITNNILVRYLGQAVITAPASNAISPVLLDIPQIF